MCTYIVFSLRTHLANINARASLEQLGLRAGGVGQQLGMQSVFSTPPSRMPKRPNTHVLVVMLYM